MMPDCGRVHLVSSENWFDRTVSADAAGIILTSLAINRRLAAHHDSSNPALTRLYMLRDAQLWNHITLPRMQCYLRRAGLINDRGGYTAPQGDKNDFISNRSGRLRGHISPVQRRQYFWQMV